MVTLKSIGLSIVLCVTVTAVASAGHVVQPEPLPIDKQDFIPSDPEQWWAQNKEKFEKAVSNFVKKEVVVTGDEQGVNEKAAAPVAENYATKYEKEITKALKKFAFEAPIEVYVYRNSMVHQMERKIGEIKDRTARSAFFAVIEKSEELFPLHGSENMPFKEFDQRFQAGVVKELGQGEMTAIAKAWKEFDENAKREVLTGRFVAADRKKEAEARIVADKVLVDSLGVSLSRQAVGMLYSLKFYNTANQAYFIASPVDLSTNPEEYLVKIRSILREMGPALLPYIEMLLDEYIAEYRCEISLVSHDCPLVKYNLVNPVTPHRLFVNKEFEKTLTELASDIREHWKAK